MDFKQKFPVVTQYLTSQSKRRPGLIADPIRFIVAHDTGNPDSTARGNIRYYERTRNEMSASAHLFVDDKEIIECIPALTATPEKAWHVLYKVDTDNKLYGCNANDAAIGVEYCYGNKINADEAYRRYVWTIAYICFKFKLDARTAIVGHYFLDPKRKTDPLTGLAHSRRSFEQLLRDVAEEFDECIGVALPGYNYTASAGKVRASVKLNIRKAAPNTKAEVIAAVQPGTQLEYEGFVSDGQNINGNAKWYRNAYGNFFWAGGVG